MKPKSFPIFVFILVALVLCLAYPALAQEHQKYTVKAGDTLWGVSQKFYGDETLWPKLWEMNRYQTTNPHQIYVGDVLTIYPMEELLKAKAPAALPPVRDPYDRGRPIDSVFPEHFTYLANPDGLAGTGVTKLKVKKIDPRTGKEVITYDEVREVGEIISSMERGQSADASEAIHGRLLLSYYDDVIVRFTGDVAKILNSAANNDPDPYFREFPIYELTNEVKEPDDGRPEAGKVIGRLHTFKGMVTVVSRVEGLTPLTEKEKAKLTKAGRTDFDDDPVAYVARITYSKDPINIGDKIFLFKRMDTVSGR